jgi:hypothetical protein
MWRYAYGFSIRGANLTSSARSISLEVAEDFVMKAPVFGTATVCLQVREVHGHDCFGGKEILRKIRYEFF